MKIFEAVRYPFSDEERLGLGEALARENQVIYDLRDEKKDVTTQMAAQIQSAEKRAADLTTKINLGFEMREVECMWMLEEPRPGMKRLIRLDTNTMVRDEPMTAAEMQQSFGFKEEEPPQPPPAAESGQ